MATAIRPGRPPLRRERAPPWPRRLPVRAGERGLVVRRRRSLDDGVQRDVGRRDEPADARRRELPHDSTDGRRWHAFVRRQPALQARSRRDRLRRADRPGARLLHAVDAVQRLGSIGPARPARQQRPALLRPAAGQEQLWRISPGEPPRLYTDADGWVAVQIEGMGIASYDVTGDGYPGRVPHQPGATTASRP